MFATAGSASAQSNCTLPLAAYLTDSDGTPLTGEVDVELRFYLDDTPDALPIECRSAAASVDDGWLRVLVDACELPAPGDCGVIALESVFEGADSVWLGVTVGVAAEELAPRQLVGAVPYAIRASSASRAETADDAGLLEGRTADEFASADDLAAHVAEGHGGSLGIPTDIAAGNGACALVDGRPICWPYSDTFPHGARYESIEISDMVACGRLAGGTLECFSRDRYPSPSTVTIVDVPAGTYAAFSVGGTNACGLTTDGLVRCWGGNSTLQDDAPLGAFDALDVDGSMACAAARTGGVVCWGDAIATFAIIGDAPTEAVYSDVAVGPRFACALNAATRGVECWGESGPPPVRGGTYDAIASTTWGLCTLDTDGAIGCYIQRNTNRNWELARVPTGDGYTHIDGGATEPGTDHHGACAIHESGEVYCWTTSNSGADGMNQVPTGLGFR